ncbi:hypothetical protein [Vitiosangium sp. GDMCC 1.1324]|uniref:hypothetical protein n=1 Tax=Vitiosangium sp. (strain GDMCC 1.1324) TaxID=2138576 RepID=UPI0011B76BE0|nr:hypothetical protein [Vitiosangium sp. GDMCC 1.1324]
MKCAGHTLWMALLLCLSACATRGDGTRPPAAAQVSGITVRVQRAAAGSDSWSIAYELPHPMHAVRFTRPGHGYRQSHWRVLEPAGLTIERRGEEDVLLAPAGSPFRTLRMEVRSYADKPEKDYQVFIPYSDGAALLYTGILGLASDGAEPPPLHVLLTPRPGERVVVAGQSSEREVRWEGAPEGTYAYFGASTAVQQGVTAVVDPGMPRHLREHIERLLPRLFAFYTQRTGSPLTFSPALFISFSPSSRSPGDINMSGGTLPGLVQLDIRLGSDRLSADDPEVSKLLSELVAHEAAHLWNSELAFHEVPGGDWMHEGGAEAFDLHALAELGAVPAEHVRKRLSDSVSECLFQLEGAPLRESSRPGKYTNYYRCGLLIFAMAEASARQANPQADIFALWGRLLRDVGPRGRYDEARLYAAFASEGVPPRTLAVIRQLVDGPNADAAPRVLEELRLLGFEPQVRDEEAPEAFRYLVARGAVRAALRQDCAAELSPSVERGAVLARGGRCQVLGEQPRIARVAGHSLPAEALAAYDTLHARCAEQGRVAVELSGQGQALQIPCDGHLARRTPYVRVGRVPFLP